MAAETIDALLIEIGFDTSKLSQEERRALDSFKRVDEGAHRLGVNVERSTRSMDVGFSALKTGAVGLAGAFAAIAAKDMVQFIAKTVSADAAVGRLSRNIGVSTVDISRWANMAKIYGGNAEQMASNFKSLSDQIVGWKGGRITQLAADLRSVYSAALTISPNEARMPDVHDDVATTLSKEAKNLSIINKADPALAGYFQTQLNLDPSLYDAMIREGDHFGETLRKLGATSDAAADSASRLELAWRKFENAADNAEKNVSRSITAKVEPGLVSALGVGTDILSDPTKGAKELSDAVGGKDRSPNSKSLFEWLVGKVSGDGYSDAPPPDIATQKLKAAFAGDRAFGSASEKEAFIRAEAVRQGQNPDVWAALARSEGLTSFYGDRDATGAPTSFGAVQLHYPGVGRNTADGLGTIFTRETGLDARDPKNEAATIRWAMHYASTHGLRDWHGWRGAAFANLDGGGVGGGGTEISINGPITIHAGPNADGEEIASRFRKAILARQSAAAQANGGQQ